MTRLTLSLAVAIAFSTQAFADDWESRRDRNQYYNDLAAQSAETQMLENRLRQQRDEMGARLENSRKGYDCGLFGCE